jgi:prepilin-type N-terminal cleavage/methylation domain-containing protein
MPRSSRGFTLIEVAVSLVLAGVIGLAAYRLISATGRFFENHSFRIATSDHLRMAVSILVGELRELDSRGGDLVDISQSSVTYRAWRSIAFVCDRPTPGEVSLTVSEEPFLGLRRIERGRDSLLIFSEGVSWLPDDDVWLSAAVTATSRGAACESGAPGVRLTLSGPVSGDLSRVPHGAPVRAYQLTRLRGYPDGDGTIWLGLSEWREGSGWSTMQPIVGPLAGRGFRLRYLDELGQATTDPTAVALIETTVVAAYPLRPLGAGSAGDSLVVLVSLRNRSAK